VAIYIPDKNFLFIQVPATASTSLGNALLKLEGSMAIGDRHSSVADLIKKNEIDINTISESSIYCCVRNPFDYFVSEWFRLRTRWILELRNPNNIILNNPLKLEELISACTLEFSQWVQHILIGYYELSPSDDRCLFEHWTRGVGNVFRMEDMPTLIKSLEDRLSQPIELTRENVTEGKMHPYWYYYNQQARKIVEDLYSFTLRRYNYVF
jgi:hypothetical protein